MAKDTKKGTSKRKPIEEESEVVEETIEEEPEEEEAAPEPKKPVASKAATSKVQTWGVTLKEGRTRTVGGITFKANEERPVKKRSLAEYLKTCNSFSVRELS